MTDPEGGTPRTDAAIRVVDSERPLTAYKAMVDVARNLERALSASDRRVAEQQKDAKALRLLLSRLTILVEQYVYACEDDPLPDKWVESAAHLAIDCAGYLNGGTVRDPELLAALSARDETREGTAERGE